MHVASANAAGADTHQHVARPDFWLREVGHFQFHVLF
jgi:hypothetical protein